MLYKLSLLSGNYIDYFFLIMNPFLGITEQTQLYLKIAVKLGLVVIPIVTGSDLVEQSKLEEFLYDFKQYVKSSECKKMPIIVKNNKDLLLLSRNIDEAIMPVFVISAKTGDGLENLTTFLNEIPTQIHNYCPPKEAQSLVFDIYEHFNTVKKTVVVAGFISKGMISLGQRCYLGPNKSGNYIIVEIEGLHCKKIPTKHAYKGQFITVCLKSKLNYVNTK